MLVTRYEYLKEIEPGNEQPDMEHLYLIGGREGINASLVFRLLLSSTSKNPEDGRDAIYSSKRFDDVRKARAVASRVKNFKDFVLLLSK